MAGEIVDFERGRTGGVEEGEGFMKFCVSDYIKEYTRDFCDIYEDDYTAQSLYVGAKSLLEMLQPFCNNLNRTIKISKDCFSKYKLIKSDEDFLRNLQNYAELFNKYVGALIEKIAGIRDTLKDCLSYSEYNIDSGSSNIVGKYDKRFDDLEKIETVVEEIIN